jgi:hypothetical protein
VIRRVFIFVIMLSSCYSCNYFSNDGKPTKQKLDTIVDFTTVSQSPSFKNCEELLDDDKTNCFRNSIRKHFTEKLKETQFSSDAEISETVVLILRINNKGKVSLKEVESSNVIQEELPDLLAVLNKIVSELPQLIPASKIGIPVTTEYQLPIKIKTTE